MGRGFECLNHRVSIAVGVEGEVIHQRQIITALVLMRTLAIPQCAKLRILQSVLYAVLLNSGCGYGWITCDRGRCKLHLNRLDGIGIAAESTVSIENIACYRHDAFVVVHFDFGVFVEFNTLGIAFDAAGFGIRI